MKCPMKHLLTLAVLSFLGTPAPASTLYVSPSGDDDNPGTEDRPIATLERARDQIRRIRATGGLPDDGMTVVLRVSDVATAILIGGGRDNIMTNNLFLNCGRAFSIDARGLGWAKGVGDFATKELIELNYKQPPWSTKYPELLNILEDDPLAPKGNVMARNICWGGPWGRTQREAEPLVKFEDNLIDVDPRFAGSPPADIRFADDSPAHKIRFQPIPLDKIGVYESDDRASWPIEHALRRDPSALPESGPHE